MGDDETWIRIAWTSRQLLFAEETSQSDLCVKSANLAGTDPVTDDRDRRGKAAQGGHLVGGARL